ncbi:MAG: DUF29 domain-containing protein [Gallionella sp.]
MATAYQTDIVAWANEQSALIRMGKFDQLDLEHIADEVADVGKSEQREFASRMAVLLAHLLKWQYQPAYRGRSWQGTIRLQRLEVAHALKESPSLKPRFSDQDWLVYIWEKAKAQAESETGLLDFPQSCPWDMSDVLKDDWFPTEQHA